MTVRHVYGMYQPFKMLTTKQQSAVNKIKEITQQAQRERYTQNVLKEFRQLVSSSSLVNDKKSDTISEAETVVDNSYNMINSP